MRKINLILAVSILVMALVAGCGKSSEATVNKTSETTVDKNVVEEEKKTTEEVIKITAATSGAPKPYMYNDGGKLYGYDIEVIEEIFSRLPQYELEWEVTEFASIFTGMDAGNYQIGVNHFGFNVERGQKYIYSDVISVDPAAIIVRDDNVDIQSVRDLPGHSTEAGIASYYATVFENYNAAHPENQFKLTYVEGTSQTPLHVSDGLIDFQIFTKPTLMAIVEDLGLTNLKFIDVLPGEMSWLEGETEDKPTGTFYLIAKGNEQLAEDMNKAFEEAVADGTIQKIGEKYLGVTDETALTLEDIEKNKAIIEKLLNE